MKAAHEEAERIVAAATAQAEELDARAQGNRERIQEDFDVTMAARRSDAIAAATKLETDSKNEARERLENARAEAESLRQRAASAATERVTRSQEVTEQVRALRSRMLSQLAEIRSQLDDVPQLLAEVENEPELMELCAERRKPEPVHADCAVTLGRHVELLAEAGFGDASPVWQVGNSYVLVAIRQ